MTSEEYGQYIDDFELGADVMPGESLTEYIERRRREFESKAEGGVIGIEVKIADEMAKGGRVGLFSGGALKGLASLFRAGKDKIADFAEEQASKKMFRSKDDIPLSTYSEMKGPIKLSDMENIPEDQLKKILRTQELGLYEETPELLKAANLLERFTKKVGGKRVIDYERAEAILGVKLKGNETLDELFKIEFQTRPENRLTDSPFKDFEEYVLKGEKKADGGRVGLFMGGPPLEGTALNIYNSMNAYGFSDQEIANAIKEAGYELPTSTSTTAEITAPNIIGSQLNNDKGPVAPIGGPSSFTGFKTAIQKRQNKLNNPGKIASFIGDFIPQQRSVADMLASGQVDTRMTSGIPLGIGSMIAKALPDKYYDMSLADQITTQAYMGYTDPNTNIGNKDPFGLNVRSAFGNYAEKAAEIVGTLEEKLARKGTLSKYDQARLDHYRNVTATKQAAVTDLGLINLAKEQEAKRQADLQAKIQAEIAAGKSLSQIGKENFTGEGQAFERRKDTFTGGKTVKSASTPGGYYSSPRKDGGFNVCRRRPRYDVH